MCVAAIHKYSLCKYSFCNAVLRDSLLKAKFHYAIQVADLVADL